MAPPPTSTVAEIVPPLPSSANVVIGKPTADEVATLVGLAVREINRHGGPGAADAWIANGTLPPRLIAAAAVWFVDPSEPEVSQYARVLRGRVCLVRRSARAIESARARQRHFQDGGTIAGAPPLFRDPKESWASMFWDNLRGAAQEAQQLAEQLVLFAER